jgi:3-oxoadipate enol-lactonase
MPGEAGTPAAGALHYRERGAGAAIVFLHAFPLHGGMWEAQLATLPAGWRGLAPDLPGFGRSTGRGASPLTMDALAADVVRLLDDVAVDTAVVCGLSMGGYIALALARRHPARLRGLVLCDTRAGADAEAGRAGRLEMADRVLEGGAAVAAEALLPRLLGEATRQQQPALVERVRAMIEATAPASIAAAQRGMAERPDSSEVLPRIAVPTLVIVGSEDVLTDVSEARRLEAGIPGARLEVLDGAGHLSNLEAPAAFDAALHRFLRELPVS